MSESTESGFARGRGASPGAVRGPARVVLDVDGLGDVRRGDVLVCHTTDPAWTPAFGVVGAVVTETGGVLSHAAIVAREIGIPAVTGALGATTTFRSGDLLEVDGTRGIVRSVKASVAGED